MQKCYLIQNIVLWLLCYSYKIQHIQAQNTYTKADSLRGSITAERAWWDIQHYNLKVSPNLEQKTIVGSNEITYKVLAVSQVLQIDLQQPLQLITVSQDGNSLQYQQISEHVYHVFLAKKQEVGQQEKLNISYSGQAKKAKNPPWDGGLQWTTDDAGQAWIATSCQGLGASVWWPCKDHMYDEPDKGMDITITVPDGYMDVSNGKLLETTKNADKTTSYHWQVQNPINNYGVNMNIGKYTSWQEVYMGEKGPLPLSYYTLAQHESQAKKHFVEVPRMLKALEHWFGPYPFYEDGYKLVEVPYLGMEHQSSVTYGNKFKNGYLGADLSDTGVGLLWDFIIVHESGHEWWANSLTYKDIADMWLHESFTAYSETLFTEYYWGKEKANTYLQGTRKKIKNKYSIISAYHVNAEGKDSDMYYKGANLIHTLRQIIDNDETFRQLLRHLQRNFYHKTVTTAELEQEISKYCKRDFSKIFDQYLRSPQWPAFEYRWRRKHLEYRYTNCNKAFEMPLKVYLDGNAIWLQPNTAWQGKKIGQTKALAVDANFYIKSKAVKVPK
jgi:aminopeptidase N